MFAVAEIFVLPLEICSAIPVSPPILEQLIALYETPLMPSSPVSNPPMILPSCLLASYSSIFHKGGLTEGTQPLKMLCACTVATQPDHPSQYLHYFRVKWRSPFHSLSFRPLYLR